MGKLNGKVAVVTGGNSGIGLATARAFINEGAKVVIFGRSQASLDSAVGELGENAIAVQGDVSNLSDLDRLFATTQETFGNVDIVFANAGVAPVMPLSIATEEHFEQVMNINVKGVYFTVQKALPVLNDGASIILNTSIVNEKGFPNFTVYSASKAAVRSFARTLSAELAERGIRVNAVSPGMVETPIFGKMGLSQEEASQFGESVVQQIPMHRVGRPEEIANAVLFLASDDSSYVLGTELPVDGGIAQL